jgi:hypothetical protein
MMVLFSFYVGNFGSYNETYVYQKRSLQHHLCGTDFFNSLGRPYSITYAERLAEHSPPRAY